MATASQTTTLWDIARLFLKLGTTAFGGPAAHIAMLQQEVVERRHWISPEEFLDHLGASNLIPGPTSTELVIHIGRRRGGWPGLLVAGTCFILPAALMVGILAWAYVRYGSLPAVSGLLYGVKPVVIAIILHALWKLGHTAIKSTWLAIVALVTLFLALVGVSPLVVLVIGAFLGVVVSLDASRRKAAFLATLQPQAAMAAAAAVGLWPIFLSFVKIGAMVFGSGYVLLVFLRSELIERHAWLTQQQLLDAVAVGQVTPGPVFTTATFLGHLLHGTSGAIAATVGIFLPAFVLVAVSAPLIPKIRASRVAGAALDGVNVASLALMALVTWQLARSALVDWITVALALSSAVLLFCFPKLNSAWLIAAAGLVGATRYVFS
ncbi:MAG: chromate efflux transporter [Candidatus Korobacteraceae bacterium]